MPQDELSIEKVVRSLRIILSVMVVATLGFGVAAVAMQFAGMVPFLKPPLDPFMTILLVVLAIFYLFLHFIVPRVIVGIRRTRNASLNDGEFLARMLTTFRSQFIVALALCEAAALNCILLFMLQGEALTLSIAAVAILFMMVRFPSAASVATWLDIQREWHAEQLSNTIR